MMLAELLRLHARLNAVHIEQWIARGLLRPQTTEAAERPLNEIEFGTIDVARVHLLYELTEDLQFDEDALETVVGLIDQLHGLRRKLDALSRAVAAQPDEVQRAVARTLREVLGR